MFDHSERKRVQASVGHRKVADRSHGGRMKDLICKAILLASAESSMRPD